MVVGGGSVQAVQVPCWTDRTLIGLGDLMYLVGDGGALRWRLFWAEFIGDVRTVWPQGLAEIEAQSRQLGGLSICWSQMTALAGMDVQILDGEFVGFQD